MPITACAMAQLKTAGLLGAVSNAAGVVSSVLKGKDAVSQSQAWARDATPAAAAVPRLPVQADPKTAGV